MEKNKYIYNIQWLKMEDQLPVGQMDLKVLEVLLSLTECFSGGLFRRFSLVLFLHLVKKNPPSMICCQDRNT